LVVEINLTLPLTSNSFDAMAQKSIGSMGRMITWITLLCLHYALLAAYSSGASVLLSSLFSSAWGIILPTGISALLFIGILGGAVFWSTKAVDYTNRFFISIKGLLLVAAIFLLMPHIDFTNITNPVVHEIGKHLGIAAPIFLGAFGFLTTIPSLRLYVGDNRKALRIIVVCGSTIPLIIYLLWLLVNLGIVPLVGTENSFFAIQSMGASVAHLIDVIIHIVKNRWASMALRGFSDIAMTTSFLGVSLGLFDFLADAFKRANSRVGRMQTALLTFIPPLIFTLFYPKGFIIALGYAAIFVGILEIILPAWMAYKLKDNRLIQQSIGASKLTSLLFNRLVLFTIVVIGAAIIALQILINLHVLSS